MKNITTQKELDDLISKNSLVAVDFWAPWCGPCRMFGAVFEAYANEHPNTVMVKVSAEDARELAVSHNVNTLPTLVIFKNGKPEFSKSGFISKTELNEIMTK